MDRVMQIYRFADFILNPCEHCLLRGGGEVFLRPKAFETLRYLVERHGRLVKKDELIDRVWAGTNVTDAVLTHCIAEVRQALQDDPRSPRYLKTIPRVGYKFIGELEETASEAEEPALERISAPASAIVVLPFVNLSSDSENEYFCDGLSEELINGLTKVRNLRVVAHSSAFTFKGRDTDAREIGLNLNVDSVLEGSVRRSGNRLRISAQLINARDGYHLWSEQFDRNLDDVFAIQDEISLAILEKLKFRPSSEDNSPLTRRRPASLEAYHLYLKGRSYWHRRYEGFLQKAMDCFQQAIEKDPLYPEALVGLADCHNSLGIWALASPGDVFPRAKELTERALKIDDALAEAHASRAVIDMFYGWNWAGAESQLRRALELNPGYALGHLWYGHYLSIVGRLEESITEVKRAQNLDPLSPTISANVGWTYHLARKPAAARDELLKALELDPYYGIAHFYLAGTYMLQDKYEKAISEYRKALELTGGKMAWAAELMGSAHVLAGDRDRAQETLQDVDARSKQTYVPSTARVCVYVGLRDKEKVLEWLERAYQERDVLLPWLKVIPAYDWLRTDARFQSLLRRMGL